MMLYVLDIIEWSKKLRAAGSCIPLSLGSIGILLKGRKYPWAPMLLVVFFIPLGLGILRRSACKQVARKSFYGAVSLSAGVCSMLAISFWLLWMFAGDNVWSLETKNRLISDSAIIYENVYEKHALNYLHHCGAGSDTSEYLPLERKKLSSACSAAATVWFLVYSCPFIAFVCNAAISAFCFLTGVLVDVTAASRLQRVLKLFVLGVCLMLLGMYASVSLSGASFSLSWTLMAFFFSALVSMMVWAYLEIGQEALSSLVKGTKMMNTFQMLWRNDWVRAVMVGAFGFLLPIYLGLNRLNQSVRKCRKQTTSTSRYTPAASSWLTELETWDWVSILTKVNFLGDLYFIMQVGVAKMTYIFLSWLNEKLSTDATFGITIIIVLVVGYTMFLLPPVPGVPVYFFTGIVVTSQGRDVVGFVPAIIIAVVTAFILKLCACCGQYMIGLFMGKSLKIQQLIGVDKVFTRAIESILKERGLKVGKVAVLVGGPDWPVSVTCGILRLNIPQMLLGTCPVIFVVGPCVLAGAFMASVPAGEESPFSMLANVFIGASVAVNMGAGFVAVLRILNVVQDNGEELSKPRPEHEAVAQLTAREQRFNDAFREATKWKAIGIVWQAVLILATCLQLLSGMVFVMASEKCFRSFKISSRISDSEDKEGLDGKWWSILLVPVGTIAVGMYFTAVLLHVIFAQAMSGRAKRQLCLVEPVAQEEGLDVAKPRSGEVLT
eukprot:gnl/TRDRNA2_/TRDRNA2_172533_c3_seq3.p1 gnl/TRDRNA2_/TRDRNA2_172533_c3~~gnl/TRDRNA2_/TRDRNA2_172533_c3_seq3.p1  ORF type:complete len:835 (+),score=121.96 gnl/TRDRNA2_/TRDRNA2_172533_c3_seq3:346-2505(+)